MASLLGILSAGANSLNAQQGAAAIASNNASNVNTPGFSRQTANLAALPGGGPLDPSGVQVLSVTQSRDRFLEAQIPDALAQAASSQARAESLASISALDPGAAQGLSAALGAFYAALRAASQNPSDPGLRNSAVSTAGALARAFNRTAADLSSAGSGIDAQLTASVSEVNTRAAAVADLNRRISVARASGIEPNELLDARQLELDGLAKLTGARQVPDAQGNVSLMLPNGSALVSAGTAAKMEMAPDPATGKLQVQLQRFDGTGPQTLGAGSVGGSLGGRIEARDGALAAATASVDTLAHDLADAINTAHRAGFGLDGSTGLDLFDAGAVQGAAARISLNAAIAADPRMLASRGSATGGTGDPAALLALIGTESQTLASGATAGTAFASIVATFGAASAQATAESSHDAAVSQQLTSLRESASGVSVDEELINMQRAQRAYEAIAKVMTATSSMLDTLMNLK